MTNAEQENELQKRLQDVKNDSVNLEDGNDVINRLVRKYAS